MRVLVVEDDHDIGAFLSAHLPRAGFAVDVARTGAAGLSLYGTNEYDLVIIDLNLPDMGGDTVCARVRQKKRVPPILILTVVAEAQEKVRLLNAGADDYLAKPFSFDELLARMRALLRRAPDTVPDVLSASDIEMNIPRHTVTRAGKNVLLTRKEFAILEYLLRRRGLLVSKSALVEHVWDASADPFSASLETHMTNLRKKLKRPLITTVHGRGYRIE